MVSITLQGGNHIIFPLYDLLKHGTLQTHAQTMMQSKRVDIVKQMCHSLGVCLPERKTNLMACNIGFWNLSKYIVLINTLL